MYRLILFIFTLTTTFSANADLGGLFKNLEKGLEQLETIKNNTRNQQGGNVSTPPTGSITLSNQECPVHAAEDASNISFYRNFSEKDLLLDSLCKLNNWDTEQRIWLYMMGSELGYGFDYSKESENRQFWASAIYEEFSKEYSPKERKRLHMEGSDRHRRVDKSRIESITQMANHGLSTQDPLANRLYYDESITVKIEDIQIAGVSFPVRLIFYPNPGLIVKQEDGEVELPYIEFEKPSKLCQQGRGYRNKIPMCKDLGSSIRVYLPHMLGEIVIEGNDQNLISAREGIVKGLHTKYSKFGHKKSDREEVWDRLTGARTIEQRGKYVKQYSDKHRFLEVSYLYNNDLSIVYFQDTQLKSSPFSLLIEHFEDYKEKNKKEVSQKDLSAF